MQEFQDSSELTFIDMRSLVGFYETRYTELLLLCVHFIR